MTRMILAQLGHRTGRAVALLVGVLLATTGFTVLTGSTATSRLIVQGTVAENARGVYDILVRPAGARTELERQRGLVRANFLAGRYGGITTEQWKSVAAVPGVEVAAPIAMVGYGTTLAILTVDITDAVDPALETQLIRVWPTWVADRGLTVAPDDTPSFVYVTRNPLRRWVSAGGGPGGGGAYDDKRDRGSGGCGVADDHPVYESLPDGTERPVCLDGLTFAGTNTVSRAISNAVQLTPRGTFLFGREEARLSASIVVPLPLLVAAIDPLAEAALTGLDRAVTSGRYLEPGETTLPNSSGGVSRGPALFSSESYVDESLVTRTERVDRPDVLNRSFDANLDRVRHLPAAATLPPRTSPLRDVYRDYLKPLPADFPARVQMIKVIRVGEVTYDVAPGGGLRPHAESPSARSWAEEGTDLGYPPWLANDAAQRRTAIAALARVAPVAVSVGIFDPGRLQGAGPLSTPLDTYVASAATGADARSTELLGGQPLAPNSNPGGYLAASPTVLLPLSALGTGDQISAVRVRVAGITGFDPLSREKVRLVAEDIAAATGLDVEVMLGASGVPQTIDLPAGSFGRPELTLAELWSRKGVAAAIVAAIDRKSIVLFGLILVVCVLFLANAAAAAVRDRRRELAILACVGWPRRRLAALILGEVTLIGLTAGVLGALLSRPLGDLIGIEVPIGRSWLAVPVAIGLCLMAAVVPAWRASRSHPLAALHPAVIAVRRRGRPRRRVAGLALANLRRTPGRVLLGAVALTVGTGGLTLVASVLGAFHGTVTGTVLGDAITVRVRGVDVVAVVATLLVAVVAVADVLYLNVRDRAGEFAALRALGWTDAALARLVVYEGAGIGVVGSLPGAALGLGLAALVVGEVPRSLMWTAGLTAAAGVALAALAAAVPALLQRRLPMSVLLAQE